MGPGARGSAAVASLARRGRGNPDSDSMGYDEVREIRRYCLDPDECFPLIVIARGSRRAELRRFLTPCPQNGLPKAVGRGWWI